MRASAAWAGVLQQLISKANTRSIRTTKQQFTLTGNIFIFFIYFFLVRAHGLNLSAVYSLAFGPFSQLNLQLSTHQWLVVCEVIFFIEDVYFILWFFFEVFLYKKWHNDSLIWALYKEGAEKWMHDAIYGLWALLCSLTLNKNVSRAVSVNYRLSFFNYLNFVFSSWVCMFRMLQTNYDFWFLKFESITIEVLVALVTLLVTVTAHVVQYYTPWTELVYLFTVQSNKLTLV